MDISNIIEGRAKKYNQFSDCGSIIENNSCKSCIRKHFSFPYTCNDGWALGDSQWKDKGNKCLNWTDDSQCKVD